MILSDLSTRKRHDTLWLALGFVLQDLQGDSSTAEVAVALQGRLGLPKREVPLVMTWLKKVAPLIPEASHTGSVVKIYGRYGRRWIWSPRRAFRDAPHVVYEAGPEQPGVIDTSDW